MEDILDVKMPPAEPKPNITFVEKEIEIGSEVDKRVEEPDSHAEEPEIENEEEELYAKQQVQKTYIPDEEVFNKPPQVQKVKKKCSEKQLAHLERIRKKALEKKAQQKAFKEEQKAKQKKYVEAERKKKPIRKKAPKPDPVYEEEETDEEIPEADDRIEEETDEEEQTYYPQRPQTRKKKKETIDRYDPQHHQPQPIYHKLSAAEIRAIQKDAISDYEIIRKERKHHKETEKAQYMEELRQKEAIRKIAQPDNDPWATAFTFG